MHHPNGDGTLPHRRRDTLDGAVPDVAYGEQPGHAGLQQEWRSFLSPMLCDVRTSADEAPRLPAPGLRQPSTDCRSPDPPPPATSVPWRTSTFRVLLISRIRYSDMLVASDSERTSIVTRSAYFARSRAAWPAELPPPTTNACFPLTTCASTVAAP